MAICEKEGCGEEFDDNVEGVIITETNGSEVHTHYYCCIAHRNGG
jgi:hypothetical protein